MDFDPVKRLGSMALETACHTDNVCKKTLPTPVFGCSISVTSSTIRTFLHSLKIGPARPTCHLIEVALPMEFLPDNVWLFLEWVWVFRCNEVGVENLPKRDFVSSSEVMVSVELRYHPWHWPPMHHYTALRLCPMHNSDHWRVPRTLLNPRMC